MIAMMIANSADELGGDGMGQVLVRNLDDAVIAALRGRAASRGLSLEAELRDVLTRAASHPRLDIATELAAVRAMTPRGPRRLAEELVREGRDER
jgi:plasmid stability protein